MKTQRIRERAIAYLNGEIKYSNEKETILKGKGVPLQREAGPASTVELRDFINAVTCHGTTVNQLGNVLAKTPIIIKVGYEYVSNGRRYKTSVWASKEWLLNNYPDWTGKSPITIHEGALYYIDPLDFFLELQGERRDLEHAKHLSKLLELSQSVPNDGLEESLNH